MKNVNRLLCMALATLLLLSSVSVFAAEECIDYHDDCTPCPVCGVISHYSPPCADYCKACGARDLPVTAEHSYLYACSTSCYVCYGGHRHVSCEILTAPCLGGTCIHCGQTVAPTDEHQYDHAYDANCNACGKERDVTLPVRFAGNSISEDVDGLAFLYDIDVAGMQVNRTTAIFDTATVGGYKLIGMGALVSNNGIVPTGDNVDDFNVLDVPVVYLYDMIDGMVTYAIRVEYIPDAYKCNVITAVPYFTIEVDGEQYTVYGESMATTYNKELKD